MGDRPVRDAGENFRGAPPRTGISGPISLDPMWGDAAAYQPAERRPTACGCPTDRRVDAPAATGPPGARSIVPVVEPMPFLRVVLPLLLALVPAHAQDSGPSQYWFAVDAINPGYPDPPEYLDRETPQATLETFLFEAEDGNYAAAAHTLDLREVPEGLRADVAPDLAEKLYVVLKRRVWVDWETATDRPDGLTVAGGSDSPVAGEPRRSIRFAVMDLDGRPVPIRLNRLKPENGDPVWLFSRQTVENIDALYRLYGPSAFEQSVPDWLRVQLFLGLELWEVLALPVLLAAAAFAGLGVHRLFKAVAEGREDTFVGSVAEAIGLPLALGLGAGVAWAFLEYVISFNGVVNLFLDPLIAALLVLAVAILVVRLIDGFLSLAIARKTDPIDTMEGRDDRDFYTNISGARRLITIIVLLFGVGAVLSQTNLLQNLGFAALGGASVLTLILAFAGRAVLSNIMSSLQIAFSKPARIGDTLMFEGEWTTVRRIHFTYVELEVWDGRMLIVPVNEFVSEVFENLTKYDAKLFRTVFIVLDHRAPVDRLREAFLEFVEGDERVADMEGAGAEVFTHDRDGIHVRFKVNTVSPSEGWTLALEVREHLLNVARDIERETGKPVLPVERELRVTSEREGIAAA